MPMAALGEDTALPIFNMNACLSKTIDECRQAIEILAGKTCNSEISDKPSDSARADSFLFRIKLSKSSTLHR